MTLIACKDCGSEVSTNAKACPKCGAKVPRAKLWLWIPLGLVAAFFTLPNLLYTKEERAAISARADCERAFPMERGRGCDQAYSQALRGTAARGEAPVDQTLNEATAKKRAAEDEADRKECERGVNDRKADYDRLMQSRDYWSASLALRNCSVLLDRADLRALVADAEIKQHVADIQNPAITQSAREQALEMLMRDYPDQGKKYAKLLKK